VVKKNASLPNSRRSHFLVRPDHRYVVKLGGCVIIVPFTFVHSNTSDSLFLSSHQFQFTSLIFLSSLIPILTFLGLFLLGLDDSNVTASDTCGAFAAIIANSITRTSQQQLALSIITLPFPTTAAAGGGGEYSYPFVRIITIIIRIIQQQQQQ
jgi:hypothetical protein